MLSARARYLTTSTLIALAAAGLLSVAPQARADRRPPSNGRAGAPPRGSAALATMLSPQTARFRAQDLNWTGCIDRKIDPGLPAAYYTLQCSTLTAPLDWNDPDNGKQVEIAVSRLPASETPAKGVLFTNPGGPGGAGLDLPLLLVSDKRKQLTRTQDIYGIDVRGTGASSNATCGGTPASSLDPRDRSGPNLDLMLDLSQINARSCAVAGGDLINYVTTDQTVRDLDLLRSVVGAVKVNWLGFSAGTWLGAQYATAFPQNVGHMVLDSNVDFTGSWQDSAELQPLGFERRFRSDFLPWVAKYHSLYKLGATGAAVEASYEKLRAQMTPDLAVPSAVSLDEMIAGSLYSKDLFPMAASVLSDLETFLTAQHTTDVRQMSLARARIGAVLPLLRRVTTTQEPYSDDASDAAFLAITCNDTPWTGGRDGLVASSQQLGDDYPLIGWATVSQPCDFWNRPDISTPVPTGVGVPPVLMVQSQHDPATPFEGAQHAADNFTGARLLTVTGEGDHGIYAGGNACVDKAVESFILTGTLPVEGATCAGMPMPDPTKSALTASSSGGFSIQAAGAPGSAVTSPRSSAASPAPGAAATSDSASVPAPGINPLVALNLLSALTS